MHCGEGMRFVKLNTELIRDYIKMKNWTIAEFSMMVEISERHMHRLLNGGRTKYYQLKKISKILDVEVNMLEFPSHITIYEKLFG